jgi:ankyrin repeat protein
MMAESNYKAYETREPTPTVLDEIDTAINNRSIKAMKQSLEESPELINLKNYRGKGNLLHYTITKGDYPELIECLVEHGVNTNLTNSNGQTPYEYAKSLNFRRGTIDYFENLYRQPKNIWEFLVALDAKNPRNLRNLESLENPEGLENKKIKLLIYILYI